MGSALEALRVLQAVKPDLNIGQLEIMLMLFDEHPDPIPQPEFRVHFSRMQGIGGSTVQRWIVDLAEMRRVDRKIIVGRTVLTPIPGAGLIVQQPGIVEDPKALGIKLSAFGRNVMEALRGIGAV